MKQTGICPKCGGVTEAEGVHNGVGYIYPPLSCPFCGWSKRCPEWGDIENCRRCTEFEKCYSSSTLRELLKRLKTAEARVKELEAQVEDLDNTLTYMKAETKEKVQELKAVVKALLECEKERQRISGMADADLEPPKKLYMKAVELAREAIRGGEQA